MDNQTNITSNCFQRDLELELDKSTSNCTQPDAYDISIEIGWFSEWIVWEGGIAFNAVYWLIILILSFIALRFLSWKFNWKLPRDVGENRQDPSSSSVNQTDASSWVTLRNWLTLKIDEEAVGKDGATFLWFQFRIVQVQLLMMVIGIILIFMHLKSDHLRESPKTLRSTGLNNIGVNGVHGFFCNAILVLLVYLMGKHGRERSISSLASHSVNSASSICNLKWLMISGLNDDITADSLFEYLTSTFINMKGLQRHWITLTYDISQILPINDQITELRNIKRNLAKSEPIKRLWWEFWHSLFGKIVVRIFGRGDLGLYLLNLLQHKEMVDVVMYGNEWIPTNNCCDRLKDIDATTYYNKKEELLSAEKNVLTKNLKFNGTVFIRFNSKAEAKAAKIQLKSHQTDIFWKGGKQNEDFRPSQWTVRSAPPGSDINWIHLKKPRHFLMTFLVWLRLAMTYLIYVFLMAAPGTIVRFFHLYGEGVDTTGSTFWKRFVLPAMLTFFTSKMTDWVTSQDKIRNHLTMTELSLSSLRSICYLEIVLYLIRMLSMKPLPLLLAGNFSSADFRLECLFFPSQGSFVACCIIVNTVSVIWINHSRMGFVFDCATKWVTSRSVGEMKAFKKSYVADFDFAENYAELASNFCLTSFFIIIFPVIGLVSCVFSILRFLSDRSVMTNICIITPTGHNLHQESINTALIFAVATPLGLLTYRRIQLGSNAQLLDPGIATPFFLLILYIVFLLFAHVKLNSFLPRWIRRLLRLPSRTTADEDEDATDSMSNIIHEYDPLAKIRAEESIV